MTPDCTTTARSSAEIIAVTPYVIGFHPADSVVVIGVVGRAVAFGVRYDLPPPDDDDVPDVAAVIARQRVQHVTVLGYGPAGRVTPAVLRLARALTLLGVRMADAIRVTGERWWSYLCADSSCCPAEGRPCRPADSVGAAEAVYGGRVALPDREALVAQVSAVGGPARQEMVAATEQARARLTDLAAEDLQAGRGGRWLRRAGRTAIREAERKQRSGGQLTADEVAWLGVLLVDPAVLDHALDRSAAEDWRIRLWTDVLRRAESGYVPAPACLLGYAAWRSGNGVLARVAIDRALREDRGHRIAGILDDLLCSGIGPQALAALGPPVRPHPAGGGTSVTTSLGGTGDGRRVWRSTRRRSL